MNANLSENGLHPVILAGGKGTRLGKLTKDTQKCILNIRGCPFIYSILDKLIHLGFEEVTIAVCYKANDVIDLLGDSYKSLNIYYSREVEPLGTGGAVKNIALSSDSTHFLVINGDTEVCIPPRLIEKAVSNVNNIVLAVFSLFTLKSDMIMFDDLNIARAFSSRGQPPKEQYEKYSHGIPAGIVVLRRDLLIKYPLKVFNIEKDYFNWLITSHSLTVELTDGFIDIGTPDSLLAYLNNE